MTALAADNMMNRLQTVKESRRILVVEDDLDIAQLLKLHLEDTYDCIETESHGVRALQKIRDNQWDLVILDVRLPGMDGLEICRQVRADESYVPIIMLTSKSSELDHVLGLEMGADDYVTKPFSVMALMSRVKAMFRRDAMLRAAPESDNDHLSHLDISILVNKRQVTISNQVVELTAKEFDLLCHFVRNPGQVFSRAELLDGVWGYGHEGYEHTVNSHINRLRTKIESNPAEPDYLETIWGVGYRLKE